MVKHEVNHLLKSIEIELVEFTQFLQDMEEKHKNGREAPVTKAGYRSHPPKKAGTSRKSPEEDNIENKALFDAFNVVVNVLTRISNLIEQFTPVLIESGTSPRSPPVVNYYYLQYVHEIVIYLIKVIEENLATFSKKLSRLTSSEQKSESFKSKMPLPVSFKFKHFKPTTLLHQDDSTYKSPQPKNYKSRLNSGSQCDDLDSFSSSDEESLDYSDEKSKRHVSNPRKYEAEANDGIDEVFHRMTDVLKLLVCTLEKILHRLRYSIRTQHPQTQQFAVIPEDTTRKPAYTDNILQCSCDQECSLSCTSCKTLHKKQKNTVSTKRKSTPVTTNNIKQKRPERYKSNDECSRHCSLNNLHATEKTDSIPKFIERTLNGDSAYPHKVEFDINLFTNSLEDEFRSHFSRKSGSPVESGTSVVLDILIECFRESTLFCYGSEEERDKSSSDEKISSGTKIEDNLEMGKDSARSVIDAFASGVVRIADQLVHAKKDSLPKLPSKEEKAICQIKNIDIFAAGSTSSEQRLRILVPHLDSEKESGEQACELCKDVAGEAKADSEAEGKGLTSEKLERKQIKGTCFRCWNSNHRGLTIHQCHNSLPSGIFELRHMEESGKIRVCFRKWDRSKEPDDWRWLKNPFHDPTRIEVEQKATLDLDPVFKVIYGPEGTMVKESLAETRLKTVGNFLEMQQKGKAKCHAHSDEGFKAFSRICLESCSTESIPLLPRESIQQENKLQLVQSEKNIMTKLGRFFDDIQRIEYGKGPPLVLKVRRQSPLNDAYNLLMAPSRISLNYYRSLRVVFLYGDKPMSTSSNYSEEDQSDELFELFSRKLFSSGEMHLFEYPSVETQCLYFNPKTQSHPQWFTFAGVVLGLIILHQKRMNVKLALCLFKCLLDRPLNINDLQEIDPLFHQNLMWMKNNDISSRQGSRKTFIIRDEVGQQVFEKELIANGRNIEVTETNKYKYIELAVKWKLAERCLSQIMEFRRGFSKVIEPCFLSFFSEKELQTLIRQPPDADLFLKESTSGKVPIITRRSTL